MRRVVRHVLVYACSLQLLLPAGWCCTAMVAITAPVAESAAPAKACCCCCPKPQTASHHQAPKPEPKEPVKPCCIEKAALPASLHQKDQQVADLPALPAESSAVENQASIESVWVLPPVDPSLHLRNCVWLC